MKTEQILVTNTGTGMQEALEATEKLGAESGLSEKEVLRLRLMAEEMFGLFRSIVGEAEADYWVEEKDRTCKIHLNSDVTLTRERRKALLSASTAGENAAVKGFSEKVMEMIAVALLPKEEKPSMLSLGLMSLGSPGGYRAGSDYYDWSMKKYIEELRNEDAGNAGAEEAKDELEKSIIASIADDVSISIVGSKVGITIVKAF